MARDDLEDEDCPLEDDDDDDRRHRPLRQWLWSCSSSSLLSFCSCPQYRPPTMMHQQNADRMMLHRRKESMIDDSDRSSSKLILYLDTMRHMFMVLIGWWLADMTARSKLQMHLL